MDSVEQFALPSVGGHHLISWGPEKNKNLKEERIHPFLPDCFKAFLALCASGSQALGPELILKVKNS